MSPFDGFTEKDENTYRLTKLYTKLAFFTTMPYPRPLWYRTLSRPVKIIWRIASFLMDINFCFFFVSNMLGQILYADDIEIRSECRGALCMMGYVFYKRQKVYKFQHFVDNVIERLYAVCRNLNDNPVGDKTYLSYHLKYVRLVEKYCIWKLLLLGPMQVVLITVTLIIGAVTDHRKTPLAGFFFGSFDNYFNFFVSCISQWLNFSFGTLFKDIIVDTIIMMVLVTVNVHISYLAYLLELILNDPVDYTTKHKNIVWWIKQHQDVFRVVTEFRKISSPCIFAVYAYTSAMTFMILFRSLEDEHFFTQQQMVIIASNIPYLIHLYLISYLGELISDNSIKVMESLKSAGLWDSNPSSKKLALIMNVRATHPLQITFGPNNGILSLESFGNIVKGMSSYFVTIYQVKNG